MFSGGTGLFDDVNENKNLWGTSNRKSSIGKIDCCSLGMLMRLEFLETENEDKRSSDSDMNKTKIQVSHWRNKSNRIIICLIVQCV